MPAVIYDSRRRLILAITFEYTNIFFRRIFGGYKFGGRLGCRRQWLRADPAMRVISQFVASRSCYDDALPLVRCAAYTLQLIELNHRSIFLCPLQSCVVKTGGGDDDDAFKSHCKTELLISWFYVCRL